MDDKTLTIVDQPLPLRTMVTLSCLLMGSIPMIYAVLLLNEGFFKGEFPSVSMIMGLAPQNKLFAIMITIYSFQKQASVMAYNS